MDKIEYIAEVKFAIFPMTHLDMIIGLPEIIGPFFTYFFKLLMESRHEITDPDKFDLLELISGDIIYPWSKPVDEPAPEEDIIPLPCAFTHALHYLGMPWEQAFTEYRDSFTSQINPDMLKACPQLTDLLLSVGQKVFLPKNWTGINGFDPIELKFTEEMPKVLKPPYRSVNKKLLEAAKEEYDRLRTYHYVDSASPICSPLVIAPKATKPFIRFAVDCQVNKYIVTQHTPIPQPQKEIAKAAGFKVFIDVDMRNSFHQFRLAEYTSNVLSVQTPWGQVRPLFMPEGITPASAILQKAVMSIFSDMDEYTIVIFDNILICAHDYDDAYRKFAKFLDRCVQRNVILKFSKTFIGNDYALFFGYRICNGSWSITEERIKSIADIPVPSTKKRLQSLLGAALFTRNFIPNFSELTAPLHELCSETCKWDSTTMDRITSLVGPLKDAISKAFTLFFPDYSLEFRLQADSSNYSVASVLFQVRTLPDGSVRNEPLFFYSHKLSDQALRWDIHKKECWALVCAVRDNEFILRGKTFTLESDHHNLLYMESHTAPIVIRWRLYLQSFSFLLRHIKGKDNVVADFGSRMLLNFLYSLPDSPEHDPIDSLNTVAADTPLTVDSLFAKVHGGKVGHWGVRHTWKLLNKFFPGHGLSLRVISDLINTCPICQKNRLGMQDKISGIVRHLHQRGPRDTIAIDLLTVTPRDDRGNQYVVVIVNLFTKLAALYATPDKEAETTASILVQYFSTYGIVNRIHSDPGSDYTADIIKEVAKCYGITQTFTIVNHPQANGVENTNQKILRHLTAMVMDLRTHNNWSHPTILSVIAFFLNSFDNSEVGAIPFELHFGTEALSHFVLPDLAEGISSYVVKLNEDLTEIQKRSRDFQDKLIQQKISQNPEVVNQYQPGDYVLLDSLHDGSLREYKLKHRYLGPYRVLLHDKNDVQCRHLVEDSIHTFDVHTLKPFFGTDDQAFSAALMDYNRFVVKSILGYSGDPLVRSKCDFLVEYESGAQLWLPYDHREIGSLVVFESFCRARPDLFPLLLSAADATREVNALKKTAINNYAVNESIFLNLRFFGAKWYSDNLIILPDKYQITYRFAATVKAFLVRNKLMEINIPLLKLTYQLNGYDIKAFVSKELPSTNILVDASLLKKHPIIKKSIPK